MNDNQTYYIRGLLRQPTAADARRYLGIEEASATSVAAGSGSVTSADFVSLRGHVVANSAQMTSADNALSAAINVVSTAAAAALSVANAVSNRLSTWTLDDLADVSAPAPTDGQALFFNSAAGQWVASTPTGGGGSVTSADFVSLRGLVQSNSAQMTSADNANSAAINVVSAAVAALSAQHTSLAGSVAGALSAIAANSAQMTSADNAISAAVAALSAQHTSLAGSVAGALSAIAANSAQMTSADNANSAAIAALSAQHTSLAASVAGALSAIAANSAQMTSADNANSAAAAAVSVRVDSVNTVVSNQGSAIVANSAQMTSANNALSANIASIGAIVSGWATSGVANALPVKRVLAGNQLVTATAPVSISGFTFTCSAGVGYKFEFGIYTSNAASLAGNKFVLSAPSSSPIVAMYAQGGAVGGVSILNVDRTNVTMANVTVSAVGVPIACFVRGTFRCSANGGTLAMAMGNNVTASTAGSAITVLAGSYGMVWRMV